MRQLVATTAAACALAWLAAPAPAPAAAQAALPAEAVGRVETLPPPGPHWFWLSDYVLERAALFDADDGRFLGMLSAGVGPVTPIVSAARGEIYLPETYYSRGSRGERTDVVTVYEARTLAPVAEIGIPPKRADVVHGIGLAALLDDERFLALYNYTPATSVSVVDVEARRFVGEIATPGCSLVYPAGPRRFAMLCGDGSLLLVRLDAAGAEAGRARSAPFFDPERDPVTEKPVRLGTTWLFVSFEGIVHPVDLAGDEPVFGETWPLLGAGQREDRWRIGGSRHLAAHAGDGRLYALVHQGGPHGHKDPGTEVWVYDVETRTRVARIRLRNELGAFAAQQMRLEPGSALAWLLERIVPNPGIDSIVVTADDDPRLLAVSLQAGSVGVYDARSGAFLRHVGDAGLAPVGIAAPWPEATPP